LLPFVAFASIITYFYMSEDKVARVPALFLSHGAGPCFFMDSGGQGFFGSIDKNSEGTKWYRQVATQVGLVGTKKPKAILVISAHWESETSNTIYVTSQKSHKSLFYDYYNFPPETYELKYPCAGSPELAQKVVGLIDKTQLGIKCVEDKVRNLDHGVFIPLLLVYPDADIPVVQLSLASKLDSALHYKIGEALAPLREEGVLIIGSGQTTHGRFSEGKTGDIEAREWVSQLSKVLELKDGEKILLKGKEVTQKEAVIQWENLPHARKAHGREEHLLPLQVIVGTNGPSGGKQICDIWAGQMSLASYVFP